MIYNYKKKENILYNKIDKTKTKDNKIYKRTYNKFLGLYTENNTQIIGWDNTDIKKYDIYRAPMGTYQKTSNNINRAHIIINYVFNNIFYISTDYDDRKKLIKYITFSY